jgi:hypothetical protein
MESEQDQAPEKKKPAMTISIQSWATPIVGLVMLVLGLFGGYYIRPMLDAQADQSDVSIRSQQPSQDNPGASGAGNQELMDYLVSQTRHFRGSETAPVTLIEFGDFQ